ncbi:uncharacterized protein LOC132067319 [Lycium ferocissimum]|uniref:uncharacterized protein LOC132067319 n=1 Tax=Lycium ferocissimum TaxID=112874 RepID=UPI0028161C2D|nr:uncharacterized protein LOC132067319 [Lycium ferocissimum]
MFSSTVFAVLILHLFVQVLSVSARPVEGPSSRIIVQGSVFCDVCCDNTFSKHSYFLSGVDVHVQCRFKASSPRTAEQISFSVNRTTNRYGVYKLDIPSVDGVDCIEEPTIQSFCQVSLIGSTSQACNVPGLKSTSNEITIKSKQNNQCIYSLDALSYRPPEKNATLCGNSLPKIEEDHSSSFNYSKFFLPYFPPYHFLWPPANTNSQHP